MSARMSPCPSERFTGRSINVILTTWGDRIVDDLIYVNSKTCNAVSVGHNLTQMAFTSTSLHDREKDSSAFEKLRKFLPVASLCRTMFAQQKLRVRAEYRIKKVTANQIPSQSSAARLPLLERSARVAVRSCFQSDSQDRDQRYQSLCLWTLGAGCPGHRERLAIRGAA